VLSGLRASRINSRIGSTSIDSMTSRAEFNLIPWTFAITRFASRSNGVSFALPLRPGVRFAMLFGWTPRGIY